MYKDTDKREKYKKKCLFFFKIPDIHRMPFGMSLTFINDDIFRKSQKRWSFQSEKVTFLHRKEYLFPSEKSPKIRRVKHLRKREG